LKYHFFVISTYESRNFPATVLVLDLPLG
jgi:hypothetical protein